MKNAGTLSIATLLLAFAVLACSFPPASIGTLAAFKDKAGENKATTFQVGDIIYSHAALVNNSEKVTVKFTLLPEDVKGMTKGENIKEAETLQVVDGGGTAIFILTTGKNFPPGTYKINAEMINEANETKDSKSINITVVTANEL